MNPQGIFSCWRRRQPFSFPATTSCALRFLVRLWPNSKVVLSLSLSLIGKFTLFLPLCALRGVVVPSHVNVLKKINRIMKQPIYWAKCRKPVPNIKLKMVRLQIAGVRDYPWFTCFISWRSCSMGVHINTYIMAISYLKLRVYVVSCCWLGFFVSRHVFVFVSWFGNTWVVAFDHSIPYPFFTQTKNLS